MTNHNALANSELHEMKGASTAGDSEVYFADGAGSGEWKTLIEVVGSWEHTTDTDEIIFEDIGNYCMIQVDISGITLDTNTNQNILLQLGSDSGFTTSSIYYNAWWHSGGEGTSLSNGMLLAFYRNASPANSLVNFSSTFITNFNQPRYTIATSQEAFDESTTATGGFSSRTHWVREQTAYNKLKIIPQTDTFTGGSVVVTGYRYQV